MCTRLRRPHCSPRAVSTRPRPRRCSPRAAASSGYQSQHAGGTVHLDATAAGGTLDPQVNYTLQYWQLYQATYDGLVSFEKVSGQSSFNVVPDLAVAMPTVTNS